MPKSNDRTGKKPKKIYLDYAASAETNPSSIHSLGVLANKKLQNSREGVANILNARKEEIIFTSGGTESNNLAIQGLVLGVLGGKSLPHIVITNIEHPSVLETVRLLERRKLAIASIVSVEPDGIVDPKKIKKELKKTTILVSVMYANNEIGTIQPIREIAKEIRYYKKQNKESNIFFHTDAVQAANYLDLNVEKLGVDMLSLSGSKIEGAGRVGVLYKKKSVPIAPVFGGGDQEMGLRPGTENLSEIIKFADALKKAEDSREKEVKRLASLQEYFFRKIEKSKMIINGDVKDRLTNNVSITIPNIPSDLLVIELSERGIMTSSKSACKSSSSAGSYVIEALRPKSDPEIGGVRFSFGKATTKKDIDYTIKSLEDILGKLGKWYSI